MDTKWFGTCWPFTKPSFVKWKVLLPTPRSDKFSINRNTNQQPNEREFNCPLRESIILPVLLKIPNLFKDQGKNTSSRSPPSSPLVQYPQKQKQNHGVQTGCGPRALIGTVTNPHTRACHTSRLQSSSRITPYKRIASHLYPIVSHNCLSVLLSHASQTPLQSFFPTSIHSLIECHQPPPPPPLLHG